MLGAPRVPAEASGTVARGGFASFRSRVLLGAVNQVVSALLAEVHLCLAG